jgi:nucleotide-binding universal stress UspA family protein
MRLSRILCPTDFSPSAEHAADVALALATSVGGSITLLHAYMPAAIMAPEGGALLPEPARLLDITDHVEATLAEAQRALAARAGAVKIDALAVMGGAAAEILRLAESGEFDLIVMGTHGRRGLQRLVLGSVAETVMRRAAIPVVTVRAGAEHQPAATPPAP